MIGTVKVECLDFSQGYLEKQNLREEGGERDREKHVVDRISYRLWSDDPIVDLSTERLWPRFRTGHPPQMIWPF